MANLEFTGERFAPDKAVGVIEAEHWHRYAFAANYVSGKRVIDIASGEGYGSAYLSRFAEDVVGIDIAQEAVDFARQKYVATNLNYVVGDCEDIPVSGNSADVVVSFETIEHHDKHEEMIAEIKRVLKVNGLLIISSPDKRTYSDLRNYHNEFHVKELYRDEFISLLKRHFKHVNLVSQSFFSGSLIVPDRVSEVRLDFSEAAAGATPKKWDDMAEYLIAVASDGQLPELPHSTFSSKAIERDKSVHIDLLDRKIMLLERHIEDLHRSTSWRISAPVRMLGAILRSVRSGRKD